MSQCRLSSWFKQLEESKEKETELFVLVDRYDHQYHLDSSLPGFQFAPTDCGRDPRTPEKHKNIGIAEIFHKYFSVCAEKTYILFLIGLLYESLS